eukprot:gene7597-7088_t
MDCQSDCVTTPLLALSCRVCPTSFAYSFVTYHICRALVCLWAIAVLTWSCADIFPSCQ